MNEKLELLATINRVLDLEAGGVQIIREKHLLDGRIFRYRDGWHFFIDHAIDRIGFDRALLGYSFTHGCDVVAFLKGTLRDRIVNFALIGERLP